jgi:3D (Asp-Asp-Asp) domain-containing protein
MEGGNVDREGNQLHTLQQFLKSQSEYVSVAMDSKAFPYGTRLHIPSIDLHFGRSIDFRVVDTGGAFKGKKTSKIDICVENEHESLQPYCNCQTVVEVIPE